MDAFQVWSFIFLASRSSAHWILAGYKMQKQIVCGKLKKKTNIPEDEHLRAQANYYLNFLSWNIFPLAAAKQQLKSAPSSAGQAEPCPQGLTAQSHRGEAASTVRHRSASNTAAAERWLFAVKYL